MRPSDMASKAPVCIGLFVCGQDWYVEGLTNEFGGDPLWTCEAVVCQPSVGTELLGPRSRPSYPVVKVGGVPNQDIDGTGIQPLPSSGGKVGGTTWSSNW